MTSERDGEILVTLPEQMHVASATLEAVDGPLLGP